MCWSAEASLAVAGVGLTAAALAVRRGEPAAISGTIGYFTAMEGLQVAGYVVLDQCGTAANQAVTLLSYLHIAFQPIFINAFALHLVPGPVRRRVARTVFVFSGLATLGILVQILPVESFGTCTTGAPLCGDALCTRSGTWHIAWDIPYNGFMVPFEQAFGTNFGFPTYMAAVFVLPLLYGAWRFVLFHAIAGPLLARALTSDPNEMPAIWCLFSIGILLIGLSPAVRRQVSADSWWGRDIGAA